ncbi:MAG: PadR family transcriptional regulator [Candidatus Ranarchaeia archaeon]
MEKNGIDKFWLRHTARVPKGMLRFYVLNRLKEAPLSGVDISKEIGEKTEGKWKPSPGSIYPLFARLEKEGLIEEVSHKPGGKKEYTLSKKGLEFFKKQTSIIDEIKDRRAITAGLFPDLPMPPPLGMPRFFGSGFPLTFPKIKPKIMEAFKEMFSRFMSFRTLFEEEIPEDLEEKLIKITKAFSKNLEKITQEHKEKVSSKKQKK